MSSWQTRLNLFIAILSFILRHALPLAKNHEAFISTHDLPPSSPHMLQDVVLQYEPRVHTWKLQNMRVRYVATLDVGIIVFSCGGRGVPLVIVEGP